MNQYKITVREVVEHTVIIKAGDIEEANDLALDCLVSDFHNDIVEYKDEQGQGYEWETMTIEQL